MSFRPLSYDMPAQKHTKTPRRVFPLTIFVMGLSNFAIFTPRSHLLPFRICRPWSAHDASGKVLQRALHRALSRNAEFQKTMPNLVTRNSSFPPCP